MDIESFLIQSHSYPIVNCPPYIHLSLGLDKFPLVSAIDREEKYPRRGFRVAGVRNVRINKSVEHCHRAQPKEKGCVLAGKKKSEVDRYSMAFLPAREYKNRERA
jgi:hypothetical protein